MTVRIQKLGNSFGISIPEKLLELLQWNDDDQMNITAEKNRIIIEKVHERKNIMELFEGWEGEYVPEEIDWGEPVGNEIW